MMTNPIGRLSANNAAYNWMSSANSLVGLCSFRGGNLNALRAKEQMLQHDMLMDSFNYKAYSLMADSQEKIQKENIKRTFSTFA